MNIQISPMKKYIFRNIPANQLNYVVTSITDAGGTVEGVYKESDGEYTVVAIFHGTLSTDLINALNGDTVA